MLALPLKVSIGNVNLMDIRRCVMSDSPLCENCIEHGVRATTHKVAGRALFRCSHCKRLEEKSTYAPEAFTWRTNKEAYVAWREASKMKAVPSTSKVQHVG